MLVVDEKASSPLHMMFVSKLKDLGQYSRRLITSPQCVMKTTLEKT